MRDNDRRFHLFMDNLPALVWIRDAELQKVPYLLIGGEKVEGGGERVPVVNPATEDQFAEVGHDRLGELGSHPEPARPEWDGLLEEDLGAGRAERVGGAWPQ